MPTASTNPAGQFSNFPILCFVSSNDQPGTGLFGGVSGNKDTEKNESASPGTFPRTVSHCLVLMVMSS